MGGWLQDKCGWAERKHSVTVYIPGMDEKARGGGGGQVL